MNYAPAFQRISVYYPQGQRTGGPEALHQLVDSLRRQGADAVLVPVPGTESAPRVSAYDLYDAPVVAGPFDTPEDAIVIPEVWMGVVRPQRARAFCWWLSADNSHLYRAELMWRNRSVRSIDLSRRELLWNRAVELARRPALLRRARSLTHIAQSQYAADFVQQRLDVPVRVVSDYINMGEAAEQDRPRDSGRIVVSYNSAKGGSHVERLRRLLQKHVEWVPLRDMTREQVRETLERSDVYVDLGHQPGKDRMPREAALLGAVTIITRMGAGSNEVDFPLPDQHKVPVGHDMGVQAVPVVTRVLDNLEAHRALQAAYRQTLTRERDVFDAQVRAAFINREDPSSP